MVKEKINHKDIEKELLDNWMNIHHSLGLTRYGLESLSKKKAWRVNKVIAGLRRRKVIYLFRRRYFIRKVKSGDMK